LKPAATSGSFAGFRLYKHDALRESSPSEL
jgi:hypothetical protein